jgi:7-keto-8-aminopelargonate synthetase-like enzyme
MPAGLALRESKPLRDFDFSWYPKRVTDTFLSQYIDLRSDTVTRPTAEMREAMAAAEAGDDVYGDDPAMNRLEELAARTLGKEAALFVPSGTMGNQICVMTHTQPGNEIIAEASCRIVRREAGAAGQAVGGSLCHGGDSRHPGGPGEDTDQHGVLENRDSRF